jgi:hypothetical protein
MPSSINPKKRHRSQTKTIQRRPVIGRSHQTHSTTKPTNYNIKPALTNPIAKASSNCGPINKNVQLAQEGEQETQGKESQFFLKRDKWMEDERT